jgi:CHAT domain-containing protein
MRIRGRLRWLRAIVACGLWGSGLSAVLAQPAEDFAAQMGRISQLYAAGKLTEAIEPARRAIASAEARRGREHPDTATAESWLALIYADLGRAGEAEPLARHVLDIREAAQPRDGRALAAALDVLGRIRMALGRNAEAETLLRRAAALWEERADAKPALASTLIYLGWAILSQNRPAEAEPSLTWAVDICQTLSPTPHAELGRAFDALATVMRAQDRLAEASSVGQRAVASYEAAFGAESLRVAIALNNRAVIEHAQGHADEAERLLRRSLTVYDKVLGADHAYAAGPLDLLAMILLGRRDYAEAERSLRRLLAIRESALERGHDDTLRTMASLASTLKELGRMDEAKEHYERHLVLLEQRFGPEHPRTAEGLNDFAFFLLGTFDSELATISSMLERAYAIRERTLGNDNPATLASLDAIALVHVFQSRLAEGEAALRRALEIADRLYGPRSAEAVMRMTNLGNTLTALGRIGEAEPLLTRSLDIRRETLGEEDPLTVDSMVNLGDLRFKQGRYAEAEALFQRALRVRETTLGDHPVTAYTLEVLASVLISQGRRENAEAILLRALAIRQSAAKDSMFSGIVSMKLAEFYSFDGRFAEAETAAKQAIAIFDRILGSSPIAAAGRSVLARIYLQQNRYIEAEALLKRNLDIIEGAFGLDSVMATQVRENLAGLYDQWGRYADAFPLGQQVLTDYERFFGHEHDSTVTAANNLAWYNLQLGSPEKALALYERASEGWIRRHGRDAANPGAAARRTKTSEVVRNSYTFAQHVRAAHRTMQKLPEGDTGRRALVRRSFEIAQWANLTEAANALTQMAARSAGADDARSGLVRRFQDLNVRWQSLDERLLEFVKKPSAARDAAAEKALRAEIADTDAELAAVRQQIETRFPQYAAMAFPAALTTSEVMSLLRDDEVLVQFLFWDDESFVWFVSKQGSVWSRRSLTRFELQDRVNVLRCGLDGSLWSTTAQRLRCRKLLKSKKPWANLREGELPPFDLKLAHDLYRRLLGAFDDRMKDKHLIVVPSGALAQLPLEVLVTQMPAGDAEGYAALRNAQWLGARQPITILPSVASLKALRENASASKATRAYVAFGNPLLEGPDESYARAAKEARERQSCRVHVADARMPGLAAGRNARVARLAERSGQIDVGRVREQVPLPETVDEVCAVAKNLEAQAGDLYFGSRATEREVRALSANGGLAKYRTLHFATHGTLAGEIEGSTEPGLILSPPTKATGDDDGYLSASEIAQLKLDADLVILSACNTAAGDANGTEALSGLARAFFYAGARAMLVSHWAVYSEAAVLLVTRAFDELKSSITSGRAEAMRRAKAATIAEGGYKAHPAYWAPFVVVGEGAVSTR